MNKAHIPWHLIIGITLGFGLGLAVAWLALPQASAANTPANLRNDFKEAYRALIAQAYAATGNLAHAEERLLTINDADLSGALQSQAQRALAAGASPEELEALAILSADLQLGAPSRVMTATGTQAPARTPRSATPTGIADNALTPENINILTPTAIPINTRTPRPTQAASPTASIPYILKTQDTLCSANITEGLLMVYVSDTAQKALSGVEIIVGWDGGEEHIFTGMKPELGNGYADFEMIPEKNYSLRLASGSMAASSLTAPACVDKDGNPYWGSLQLKFEKP